MNAWDRSAGLPARSQTPAGTAAAPTQPDPAPLTRQTLFPTRRQLGTTTTSHPPVPRRIRTRTHLDVFERRALASPAADGGAAEDLVGQG
eukprot:862690-Rhodomonas_salina.1